METITTTSTPIIVEKIKSFVIESISCAHADEQHADCFVIFVSEWAISGIMFLTHDVCFAQKIFALQNVFGDERRSFRANGTFARRIFDGCRNANVAVKNCNFAVANFAERIDNFVGLFH